MISEEKNKILNKPLRLNIGLVIYYVMPERGEGSSGNSFFSLIEIIQSGEGKAILISNIAKGTTDPGLNCFDQ